ncbi:MAG: hypothetical protein N2Z79_03435 [Candidatus Omnitrophica bacterium]|nr:hypothetical protein [Candidatus Omnitrophota bacterium]
MNLYYCPGSKRFRQPQPRDLECPQCGEPVELWSDEKETACPKCKNLIFSSKVDTSCLDWCKYAKDCIGEEKSKNIRILNNQKGA